MPKKNAIRHARIKCSTDGQFHKVEFHPDGRVTQIRCGTKDTKDITQDVERTAGLLRLGKAPAACDTCAAFGALVLHGCEVILRRPADDEGIVRDLSGWRDIYVRFESSRLVVDTMNATRKRLRKEGKAYVNTPKGWLDKANHDIEKHGLTPQPMPEGKPFLQTLDEVIADVPTPDAQP